MRRLEAMDLFGPIFGALVFYHFTSSVSGAVVFVAAGIISRVIFVERSQDHDQ